MKKSTRRVAARGKSAAGKTPKKRPASRTRAKAAPRRSVANKARGTTDVPAVDPFYLKLDSGCTLRDVVDMQFSLVAANGDPVIVDGGDVERVDTAGLQLLVALARRQQQAGRRLSWKAASPLLLKCGERLGLIEALGLTTLPRGEEP